MKLLRRMIRQTILESNSAEEKISSLMVTTSPDLKQAISLGEALGIVKQYEDKPLYVDLKHETVAVFVCDGSFLDALKKAGGYGFNPGEIQIGEDQFTVAISVPHTRANIDQFRRMR